MYHPRKRRNEKDPFPLSAGFLIPLDCEPGRTNGKEGAIVDRLARKTNSWLCISR